MTAVVEPDTALVDRWREALEGPSVGLRSLADLERHLATHPHEQVVVLGTSVTLAEATGFAEQQRLLRPWLAVVLVRGEVDTTVLTQALGAGVRTVVDAGDVDGLVGAVERAREFAQRSRRGRAGPRRPRPGWGRPRGHPVLGQGRGRQERGGHQPGGRAGRPGPAGLPG